MKNKIEIYRSADNSAEIKVQFDADTVGLTQAQMVELFESSKANISEHISHIFSDIELVKDATVRKFRTVELEDNRQVTRARDHYNFDMITSIGYKVNSKRGIWRT